MSSNKELDRKLARGPVILVLEDELRKAIQAVNTLDGVTPDDVDYLTFTTAGLLLQELGFIIASTIPIEGEEDSEESESDEEFLRNTKGLQ